jgi:hypothetical protein
MDIEAHYQKIIEGLEKGSRALIRFSPQELEELAQLFQQQLSDQINDVAFEKILCLMDHSAVDSPLFGPSLLEALSRKLSPRQTIFALNCARKHIIQAHFKKGQRLEYDFLKILQSLLYSSSPEIVEWTLRTIEECGSQGVYFLPDFAKIKPSPWKWFNAHQRAVIEIITMLERRWSRFEKS